MVLAIVAAVKRLHGYVSPEPGAAGSPECLAKGAFDGSCGVSVRGEVRLFVCHFFCISCVAALCHFARRFPHVRLRCDYDDCWHTRLLDIDDDRQVRLRPL